VETAGHSSRLSTSPRRNRLSRIATTFYVRQPRRCSNTAVRIAVGGNRGRLFTFDCGAKPFAQTVFRAVTHPKGLAFSFAKASCLSGGAASAAAAASSTPATIHLRGASESVGLQLLRRRSDL
jgi:hypothetical protein